MTKQKVNSLYDLMEKIADIQEQIQEVSDNFREIFGKEINRNEIYFDINTYISEAYEELEWAVSSADLAVEDLNRLH